MKLLEKALHSAAQRSQLENITRSSITELGNGLIQYMKGVVEEIVDTYRSARNTNYLINRNT